MKQGNLSESKKFNFGVKFRGNMIEVKMRFKEDIAYFIITYVRTENMFWTPVTNKGMQTLYGHMNQSEFREFMRHKDYAMANRLNKQATALINKHHTVEPDELPF